MRSLELCYEYHCNLCTAQQAKREHCEQLSAVMTTDAALYTLGIQGACHLHLTVENTPRYKCAACLKRRSILSRDDELSVIRQTTHTATVQSSVDGRAVTGRSLRAVIDLSQRVRYASSADSIECQSCGGHATLLAGSLGLDVYVGGRTASANQLHAAEHARCGWTRRCEVDDELMCSTRRTGR